MIKMRAVGRPNKERFKGTQILDELSSLSNKLLRIHD